MSEYKPVEGRDFVLTSGRTYVTLPGRNRPVPSWRYWLSRWLPIRHKHKGRIFVVARRAA